jgi:hypothetical protein
MFSFPTLDTAHVVSMEVREFGQLLLRKAPFKAERPRPLEMAHSNV